MSFDPDEYLREAPTPADLPAGAPSRRIAVVGMAGRFPGARDVREFWANLRAGRESISFFSEAEAEHPTWAPANSKDPNYVFAAGILDDADCFDAAFFGYSPREAEFMDPQQRVFLELCWAALEDAGYDPRGNPQRTGIFGGTVYSTYLWGMLGAGVLGNPAERMLATVGNLEDNLTTRVAYKLNLRGPAITVQTACSSSLVAVHLACQNLLDDKCEMAVAGGVCIVFPQKTGYLHNPDLIDSKDGHCRAFCKGSTGAVFSNGAGVVVLKRYEAAVRDGDAIHAVILGSAINNDGNDKIGFTAPSISGQAEVIRNAMAAAAVEPGSISYVEAHGTGTPLGDPIEIGALAEAFGGDRLPRGSCAIGSAKSNVGHLNVAAGVTGLIKTILALRHRQIPPSLHFTEPNPALELDRTPFRVNAQLTEWAAPSGPRRAGVSSFGVGGTNAHVVLEEAPARAPGVETPGWQVLTVSGRDQAALDRRVAELADWLADPTEEVRLANLAYTLNTGRPHLARRVAFVAETIEQFGRQLQRYRQGDTSEGIFAGSLWSAASQLQVFGPDNAEAAARGRGGAIALAAYYAAGSSIDWGAHYRSRGHVRLHLPTYPFARTKHWWRAIPAARLPLPGGTAPPGAGPGAFWSQLGPHDFRRLLQVSDPSVGDHRIAGEPVLAGVAHLVMAREAASHLSGRAVNLIRDVLWLRPLAVPGVELTAAVHLGAVAGGFEFTIASGDSAATTCASGTALTANLPPAADRDQAWIQRYRADAESEPVARLYTDLARRGVEYGPHFRRLAELWRHGEEVLGILEAPTTPDTGWSIDLGVLDSALQATCALYPRTDAEQGHVFLPYSAREVQFHRPLAARTYVLARAGAVADGGIRRFDVELFDEAGRLCVRWVDLCCKSTGRASTPAMRAETSPRARESLNQAGSVELRLRRLVAAALHVDEKEIDLDQAHVDHGVDSVLAVGIVKSINDEFAVDVRVTDLFSYSSIRKLSAYLAGRLPRSEAHPAESSQAPGAPSELRGFAIIGMSGRFPGAPNTEVFWDNLERGVDSVRAFPPSLAGRPAGESAGGPPWRGGFLDRIDEFDPLFFNISPLEAEAMDPQQRLFLEESWSALEDAGYPAAALDGSRCGVFVGVSPSDYGERLMAAARHPGAHAFTGNATSILAARIAYVLNLRGPCVALDTACSSALVAVHAACQSIRAGDCEIALAGGVHLMATTRIQRLSAEAGMLSPTGSCRTFDDGADGMVLAEAVGVVVLKELARALEDNDPIYAVIRGSGINQDGKTNGITAPSALAQTELELSVYDKAGINPETITLVEAHGTGTALGDPIELRALSDAFRRHTSKVGFCALGSVKTNLGHSMAAAGMPSLIKVLLSLRHGRIPASLHFDRPSGHFDFASSPFFVVRENVGWATTAGRPRRAAVSSFGFSGTNAHLLLEEAPGRPAPAGPSLPCFPIPLSAKTPEALETRIADLRAWLARAPAGLELADLAYTLAVRRIHLPCRAFWAPSDRSALATALTVGGKRGASGDAGSKPAPFQFAERAGTPEAIAEAGAAFLGGAEVHWEQLFPPGGRTCLRIPLYPFARERHWIASGADDRHPAAAAAEREASFQPEAWLAREHLIAGEPVVPGSAFLDLAVRGNGADSAFQPLTLTDAAWLVPLRAPAAIPPLRVTAGDAREGLDVQIMDGTTCHFRCHVLRGPTLPTPRAPTEPPIEALHSESAARQAEGMYEEFQRQGLAYGPSLRAVRAVLREGDIVWSRIAAPAGTGQEPYRLHPSILDAAFQTTAFAPPSAPGTDVGQLPHSIEKLLLLRPLLSEVYARVRRSGTHETTFRSFDIDLLSPEGELLVRVSRYLTKAIRPAAGRPAAPAADFFYRPVWRSLAGAQPSNGNGRGTVVIFRPTQDHGCAAALAAAHAGQTVVQVYLGRGFERLKDRTYAIDVERLGDWQRVAASLPEVAVIYFLGGLTVPGAIPDVASLRRLQDLGTHGLFHLARAFALHEKPARSLVLKVVTAGVYGLEKAATNPSGGALCGLAKVMGRELPGCRTCLVDLDPDELTSHRLGEIAAMIAAEDARAESADVALRNGRRYERQFDALALPPAAPNFSPYRKHGTYLILGGAGGIGFALACRLARTHAARLMLVGRRAPDKETAEKIRAIEAAGGAALYCQAAGTDLAAMRHAVERTREHFGPLHGVIHSALVLADSALWKMDAEQFHAAFDPKVEGSWALAEATAGESLDFLAFFSSSAGVFGNPGQGNYAAGCAFKDAFAHYLAALRPYRVRSIDWGYWGEIGAVATDSYRQQLARNGIESIATEEGLDVVERVLADSEVQVVAIKLAEFARKHLALGRATGSAGFATAMAAARAASHAREPEASLITGLAELSDHGLRSLLACLSAMGLRDETAPRSTAERLATLGAQPRFSRWMEAALDRLVRARLLDLHDGRLHLVGPPAGESPAPGAASRERHAPYWRLLEACLAALPDVLRGKVRATEVIFPANSLSLVGPIYGGNPLADFYNGLVADAAIALVAQWRAGSPARKVRILEIGAGTGASSAALIERLAPHQAGLEYVFTDISASFFVPAQARFAQCPFVSYKTFDLERDPSTQGFEVGGYDLVIASNVVHASSSLADSVDRIHALLRPGGILVLNELTQNHDFLLLTFGLTEGWWKFSDPERAGHDSPLLDFTSWSELLRRRGFAAVEGLGGARWGNHVIACERDGAGSGEGRSLPPAEVTAPLAEAAPPPVPARERHLREMVAAHVWRIFAERLKLSGRAAAQPSSAATFDQFGVDSLITMDLVARLESDFGKLPKTLLFEHATLGRLSDYLTANHRSAAIRLVGGSWLEVAAEAREANLATPAAPPAAPAAPGRGDIAIVGISGRYPGAATLEAFWTNLATGTDSITGVPSDRWDVEFFESEAAGTRRSYNRWGGFIEDIDKFDPLFFGIAPRTAELMDPQERVFLETAWAAMEDAGYTRSELSYPGGQSTRRPVGVFAGVMYGSYQLLGSEEWAHGRFVNTSSGYWCIPNRVSYVLDLEGPSLAIDSACSSSLSALHLACDSLRNGDCEMAFAGGVNLILHPSRFSQLCSVNMLSPDGVCRPFGEGANGFVEGEGVGVVLLKPLAAAQRDGDNIRAVIKGSALNSGGKTSGFTVPNPSAQALLVRKALARSGLTAADISYVEAHGTGTALGDPIEVAGLSQAFREDSPENQFCAVGSLKSNVGHLEAAAGIAAVTKVTLMLEHCQIPPSLHAEQLNPLIEFATTPFRPQRRLEPWAGRGSALRRAGVSSFGAGGANAHLILEEYLLPAAGPEAAGPEIFVLSARTPERLRALARQFRDHIRAKPASRFRDAAYTLQVGREPMEERLALVAEGWEAVATQLTAFLDGGDVPAAVCLGSTQAAGTVPTLGDSVAELTFIRTLYEAGSLGKVATFWASGSSIDWRALQTGRGSRRVPLPTYPFARVRCWVPSCEAKTGAATTAAPSLHPLISRNVSTIKEARFEKVFSRADRVISDHVVSGRPILAGVAYLEMARAAAEQALQCPVTGLSNVVWLRPLALEADQMTCFVNVAPAGQRTNFEVWTGVPDRRVLHARGTVLPPPAAAAPAALDLAALIDQANRRQASDQIYANFLGIGMAYGPGFQTIRELWRGAGWSLARLDLGAGSPDRPDYFWPPGLLDGALQAIVGLSTSEDDGHLQLPFSLGLIQSFGPLPDACYVWVRRTEAPGGDSTSFRRFEVLLLDDSGRPLLRMGDCALRAVRLPVSGPATQVPTAAPAAPDELRQLLLRLQHREISWDQAARLTALEPAGPGAGSISPHARLS